MAYGLLLLRVVVGTALAAHGAQKLFGWFGGHGPQGTSGFFEQLGFRPGVPIAIAAGLSETAGILLAVGFLSPLGALGVATVMVVASGAVHWRNGFWGANGGYEYTLIIWAAAVALAFTGPGRFSVDRALGWDDNLSGWPWGLGVAGVSLLAGLTVLALRERPPETAAADAPLARERERSRAGA